MNEWGPARLLAHEQDVFAQRRIITPFFGRHCRGHQEKRAKFINQALNLTTIVIAISRPGERSGYNLPLDYL